MEQYADESMLEMFVFETTQNLSQLEQLILNSEGSSTYTTNQINEIFRIMHTIKGSSAMMGFDGLSSLAHTIEDLFFYIRENAGLTYDAAPISDVVLECIDFIGKELEIIKEGRPPEGDAAALTAKSAEILRKLKQGGSVGDGGNYYAAVVSFETGCGMEDMRAFNVRVQLQEKAEQVSVLPEEASENVELIIQHGFALFFKTDMDEEETGHFFRSAPFVTNYRLTRYQGGEELMQAKADFENLLLGIEPPKTDKTEAAAPGSAASAPGNAADHPSAQHQINQSIISVSVTRLDELMDMVGELVIAESMVIHNPELNGLELENFYKSAHQLHKIIKELQDLIMAVRMVPLSGTFQRMKRIVRDMSKKLGKEVELVIEGADTEVDKNIIDHIADPLMHLVRNSLDHGIESPDERVAAGKPAKGTVMLEARNESGEILIFVRDDGRGLSREKLLHKAKEHGLLTRPESEMTDREIYSLIFLAGFSTKEAVTEFSGRGVGMDVVMKNIELLSGRVTVDSEEGFGTEITIRFPVTLAIIEGMNLRVGNSRYTLPITAIRETIRPNLSDVVSDPDHHEMLLYRGKCVPLIRLYKLFGTEPDSRELTDGIFILAENAEKSVCLFADELLGQTQVVVKPLPRYIPKIRGIAGCTILGDGGISLILDAAGLTG